MTSNVFSIQEHTFPSCHIREYAHATSGTQEDVLHLAVKQYTPLDNPNPKRGDITIIGAHANGFPKELYEPLWIYLYHDLKRRNLSIRSIWIADVAHQGHSSVLNESLLGNDPSWYDHPRDLLLLVNHFRSQMPRPILGVGHSMGGAHLAALSLIHPRLFTSLLLIDPVISPGQNTSNWTPARASASRREIWPSRKAAAQSYKKSKFYSAWHPDVLDLWIEYGLRDLPTALHPLSQIPTSPKDASQGDEEVPVTLTTTKHQEVLTFARLRPQTPSKLTHADVDDAVSPSNVPIYRPEPVSIFARMPNLRPSVLYVFGSKSDLSTPAAREAKMEATGTGVGGSGGKPMGRVEERVLDTGHLVPMELPEETAREAGGWIEGEMGRWREDERRIEEAWGGAKGKERSVMSADFVNAIKGDWTGKNKGAKL